MRPNELCMAIKHCIVFGEKQRQRSAQTPHTNSQTQRWRDDEYDDDGFLLLYKTWYFKLESEDKLVCTYNYFGIKSETQKQTA